jgi:hypothetical protein
MDITLPASFPPHSNPDAFLAPTATWALSFALVLVDG